MQKNLRFFFLTLPSIRIKITEMRAHISKFMISLLVLLPTWIRVVANDDIDKYAYPDLVIPQETPTSLEQIKAVLEQNDQYFKDIEILDNRAYPGKQSLLFYFLQQLDASDSELKVPFYQRAVISNYVGPDALTVLYTNGYDIYDPGDIAIDNITQELNANEIEVEHRYHGESKPSEASYAPNGPLTSENYWDKCRATYASHDLCTLVNTLKKLHIFTGKWLSTGLSKDGMTTTFLAMHYPNTCDAYLPFCAPFCKSMHEPITDVLNYKYLEFMKEEDKITGQNMAELWEKSWYAISDAVNNPELRRRLMDIQKENMLNQGMTISDTEALYTVIDNFLGSQWTKITYFHVSDWARFIPARVAPDAEVTNQMVEDMNFYLNLDFYDIFNVQESQTRKYIRRKDNLREHINRNIRRRTPGMPPSEVILQIDPYDVQSIAELGSHCMDFPCIKEVLENAGYSYDDFTRFLDTYQKPPYSIIMQLYPFTPIEPQVKEFVKTTDCKILFVYGQYDPWSSAGIQDSDIPASQTNVQRILVPAGVHSSRVSDGAAYSPLDPNIGRTIIEKTKNMLSLTTGINPILNSPKEEGQIYNLAGQRVANSYRGFVIKNGKKKYLR